MRAFGLCNYVNKSPPVLPVSLLQDSWMSSRELLLILCEFNFIIIYDNRIMELLCDLLMSKWDGLDEKLYYWVLSPHSLNGLRIYCWP